MFRAECIPDGKKRSSLKTYVYFTERTLVGIFNIKVAKWSGLDLFPIQNVQKQQHIKWMPQLVIFLSELQKSKQELRQILMFVEKALFHFQELVVGVVLAHSGKSQITLGAHCVQLYPLHFMLSNFTDHYKRALIISGENIFAYLPTTSGGRTEQGSEAELRTNRLIIFCALHCCDLSTDPMARPLNL